MKPLLILQPNLAITIAGEAMVFQKQMLKCHFTLKFQVLKIKILLHQFRGIFNRLKCHPVIAK